MKFIKLTKGNAIDSEMVTLNVSVDKILFYFRREGENTLINFGKENYIRVNETPEQIEKMLKGARK